MDKELEELFEDCNFKLKPKLKKILDKCIIKKIIKVTEQIVDINIEFNEFINYEVYEFIKKFNDEFETQGLKINPIFSESLPLNDYIISFLEKHKLSLLASTIKNQHLLIKDNTLKIEYYHLDEKEIWLAQTEPLQAAINALVNQHINLVFEYSELIEQINQSKIEERKIQQELLKKELELEKKSSLKQTSHSQFGFKYAGYDETNIIDIALENPKVKLTGKIFYVSVNDKPKQCNVVKLGISDNTSAIYLKKMIAKEQTTEFLNTFKINCKILVHAELEKDRFEANNEITGLVKYIELLDNNLKTDLSTKKRVEFISHTKMTSYDGMINPSELADAINGFGYPKVGICDRSNVQIFPEIEKAFQKLNAKPIYGVELEILNRQIPSVLNPDIRNLEDELFPLVIFDLETTGLFPNLDEIIEFGAVKITKDRKVEKIDFFIKPTNGISAFTEQLTKISNKDVENAVNEQEGIKQIYDFIQDCSLIAHNGIAFDFKFLDNKFKKYGLGSLKNPCIDTLIISRILNKDASGHTLGKLCKKYRIEYDAEAAHRADYDADVLYRAWLEMLVDIKKEWNVSSLTELNDYCIQNANYKASRGYIVNLYAKNQVGIKDLYELVSIAHTTNFANRPIIFWDDLNKLRTNLLVANNPIESDLINALFTEDNQEISKQIQKYDFILLGSPAQFKHEIRAGLYTDSNIKSLLTELTNLAQQANKVVVATSNVYYLDEDDEKYHKMFINTPILNKKPHRFAKYKEGPLAYLRTVADLKRELAFLNDDELINDVVIENSIKIANQIEDDIIITKKELFAPNIEGVDDKVINEVYKNARAIYGEQLPKIVENQIKKELDSIISNKYAVVYWVSHLLVKKSISDGYVVGSRGSVGSSIVATFLKITDVNPLPPHYLCKNCQYSEFHQDHVDDGFDLEPKPCPKCKAMMNGEGHNIPFETFLGFKGDKVPDIDLNFSGVYQNKAHEFIKEMFGDQKAFRAGTISTIAEKTSFAHAREYFQRINREDVPFAEIHEYSLKCLDSKKTTGQHPGGIVVVPENMSVFEFTPYNFPADDTTQEWKTTHFAFEYIHDNLLKFDILGHDNPTILKILKDLTGIDSDTIPNHDENTLKLFTDISIMNIKPSDLFNETTGSISLPEFGTKFVREMLRDAQPKSFADLIRISGLSHGTDVWIDNAQYLIKNGKTLKEVIGCRDDIMIFLINQGIEPSIAFKVMEDVRKGKQISEEYQKILRQNNVPDWYIESANKIKYMFPKAHATAYVLHAWKFAWYKLNYPLEYYASYLTVRTNVFDVSVISLSIPEIKEKMMNIRSRLNSKSQQHTVTTKEKDLYPIYEVILEAKLRGINFEGINLEKSAAVDFVINKATNSITCPFICLDGLGEKVAESIIQARNEKSFSSLEDFCQRTKITKQHLAKLKELKVLDSLSESEQISLFNF